MIALIRARKTPVLAVLLAGTATFASPGASQSVPAGRCEAMAGTEIRPGLTITGARHVAASPFENCASCVTVFSISVLTPNQRPSGKTDAKQSATGTNSSPAAFNSFAYFL